MNSIIIDIRKSVALLLLVVTLIIISATIALAAPPPTILYTDIISGPNTGGEYNNGVYLSIFGKNFGSDINAITVTVGGGAVATKKYIGSSYGRTDIQQISVQLGASTASGVIKVSVDGMDSNIDKTFTVRAGDIFFVSTSGSDSNAGSYASPFRTVNHAIGQQLFGPGDFVVIRGGTYDISSSNENLITSRRIWIHPQGDTGRVIPNGTSLTNQTTVYGYPGETITCDFGTLTSSPGQCLATYSNNSMQYWTVANIIVDAKDFEGGAIVLGSYLNPLIDYFKNGRIVNIKVQGGMAGTTLEGHNVTSWQSIEGTKILGFNLGNQSSKAPYGLRSHAFYMSHFYTDVEIGYSYFHDNAKGRAFLQIAGDQWGATPYTQGSTWGMNTNVRVHDNVFRNLPDAAILCNLGSFGPIYIYNNIIDNVATKDESWPALNLKGANYYDGAAGLYYLYNNTIYSGAGNVADPGQMITLGFLSNKPEHVTLYNNIFYAKSLDVEYWKDGTTGNNQMTADRITSNNNIWCNSAQAIPFWAGSVAINNDPLFADKSNGNFDLGGNIASGKGKPNLFPAFRRDFAGRLRPKDTISIGAYEFVSVVASPAQPRLH